MTKAAGLRPGGSRRWLVSRAYPWWRIPLYPATFLAAFVVLTWANAGLPVAMVVRPLLVAAVVPLVVTLIVASVLRDRDRAALVVTLLVLLLLSSDDRFAVIVLVGAAAIVVEAVIHRGRPSWIAVLVTRVLTGVSVILVITLLVSMTQADIWPDIADDLTDGPLPPAGTAAASLPDIFVIILDAYPGDRAAALATDFDADAFPDALTDRGFDVVRDAHSNYLLTPLTLSSMLTMRHLVDIPGLEAPYGPSTRDWQRLRAVLDDAPVLSTLRERGYVTIAIDPGYAHAHLARVDRFVEQPLPDELEVALLTNTRLGPFIEAIVPGAMADIARRRIDGAFATLERIAKEPHDRPRVVFAHVPAPHPPWVFEADGRPRNPSVASVIGEPALTRQEALDAGFAQATHIADLTTAAIDSLTAAGDTASVVVVMSDHGPVAGFSTVKPLDSDYRTRASNFMAARTPGHPGLIGSQMTPVNVFVALFDAYLAIHTPRQPDSIWAWRDSYLDAVEVAPIEGWTR